ncbi:hypothetical protein NECID01_1592 [Nematocida sp. AWRm77]|nr:hypothetical protein NECID01_1592 [Nematocida sp. AWRm77]
MTLPSELAMNIRIIKALGDLRFDGPMKHFTVSCILKKLKKPNIITGDMFWRFLSTYYDITDEIHLQSTEECKEFVLEEHMYTDTPSKC